MHRTAIILTVAILGVGLLATLPSAEAFPGCPDAVDDATCRTYDHHAYCAKQKPPYLGDSWRCFANPDPW